MSSATSDEFLHPYQSSGYMHGRGPSVLSPEQRYIQNMAAQQRATDHVFDASHPNGRAPTQVHAAPSNQQANPGFDEACYVNAHPADVEANTGLGQNENANFAPASTSARPYLAKSDDDCCGRSKSRIFAIATGIVIFVVILGAVLGGVLGSSKSPN